ncbi:MAG TPA: hypothetical protein VM011_06950 [Gammaproteobacteria bacterium]|nr:hypothetical protein [Gammaproteobacteria bacterium]
MKYSSMVIAAALAVSGMAYATDEKATTNDRHDDNMVECLSDFLASEQDESTKEKFIAECMQSKEPKAQQPANDTR